LGKKQPSLKLSIDQANNDKRRGQRKTDEEPLKKIEKRFQSKKSAKNQQTLHGLIIRKSENE